MPITLDTQYLAQTNKIAELKRQQEKLKPRTYFLVALLMLLLWLIYSNIYTMVLMIFIGGASVLTGFTVMGKRNKLGEEIQAAELELESIGKSPPAAELVAPPASTAQALTDLKTLLDQSLITPEEYATKKADILKRL